MVDRVHIAGDPRARKALCGAEGQGHCVAAPSERVTCGQCLQVALLEPYRGQWVLLDRAWTKVLAADPDPKGIAEKSRQLAKDGTPIVAYRVPERVPPEAERDVVAVAHRDGVILVWKDAATMAHHARQMLAAATHDEHSARAYGIFRDGSGATQDDVRRAVETVFGSKG